jgi:hypothetical protein
LEVSYDRSLRDKFWIVQDLDATMAQAILDALTIAGIGGTADDQELVGQIKITFLDIIYHPLHSRYIVAPVCETRSGHHDIDHIAVLDHSAAICGEFYLTVGQHVLHTGLCCVYLAALETSDVVAANIAATHSVSGTIQQQRETDA